jgi:hypothetical protein
MVDYYITHQCCFVSQEARNYPSLSSSLKPPPRHGIEHEMVPKKYIME